MKLYFLLPLLLFGPVLRAEAPTYAEPLGIAWEEWPYPHEVRYLPLRTQGQDLRMAYMDVPPTAHPNGRAVVLLHGKNFSGAYFAPVIRILTGQGFRVIAPDQIGWGKSPKPDLHYSFDLLAANTIALLDHLKIDRVVVLGHSMGGMLAAHLAYLHPGRVSHLVLENPIGLEDYRLKGVPPRTLEDAYQSELKKTAESIRGYAKTYFVEWKDEYEQLVEPPIRITLSGEYPRFAYNSALTFQMIYQQPVRHEFPLIRVPTLLIIGQEDRTAIGRDLLPEDLRKTVGDYPRLGRDAAEDIPGAKLVELANVGHIPHVEAPELFFKALLDFLK